MVRNIIRKRVGRDKLNTYAEFQGLSLKNGVDIWTFVRYGTVQKSQLGIAITTVSLGFNVYSMQLPL